MCFELDYADSGSAPYICQNGMNKSLDIFSTLHSSSRAGEVGNTSEEKSVQSNKIFILAGQQATTTL